MSDNVLLARLLQEGLRLHQAGNLAEAEGRYRAVLAQERDNADALHYLGLIAFQNKRYDSAVDLIAKSIAAADDNAAAHSNLANALTMLGRLPEAEAALDQALRIDPRFADAAFNRGNVLRQQERLADAENAYRQAIAIDANHVGALNNLAQLLELRGDRVQAAAAQYALGNALNDLGRHQDAAQAYDRSLALAHHPGVELKRLLNIPVIPASPAQIDEMRTRLFSDIASFGARGIHLPDPLPYASAAIFYTGYHGRNDRELRKVLADLYIKTCPDLEWRAPHCTRYAGPSGKIRVGFISRFLARGHPIGKHYAAIMDKIDRSRFEVVALRIDASNSASPEADTRTVALRDDLAAARQAIAAERLDVLFYTDIGMEPTTYFLAFARLAPVQCVTLGHPVTTGIPNIDYFLSADVLEPADAAEHYSETLIRMVNISSYFTRRAVTGIPPRRADLGLPVDARLYVCGTESDQVPSGVRQRRRRDPAPRSARAPGALSWREDRALGGPALAAVARTHPGRSEPHRFSTLPCERRFPGFPAERRRGTRHAAFQRRNDQFRELRRGCADRHLAGSLCAQPRHCVALSRNGRRRAHRRKRDAVRRSCAAPCP